MTVFAELTLPSLDIADAPLQCPTCGQRDGLVVTVDVEDRSETPAFLRCSAAHQWADLLMTRGLAGEIFDLMKSKYPETIRLTDMDNGQAVNYPDG